MLTEFQMLLKWADLRPVCVIGEQCELTCRDAGSSVVLLPTNMTVDALVKDHWRNPPKVQVQSKTLWYNIFLTIINNIMKYIVQFVFLEKYRESQRVC